MNPILKLMFELIPVNRFRDILKADKNFFLHQYKNGCAETFLFRAQLFFKNLKLHHFSASSQPLHYSDQKTYPLNHKW